MKRLIATLFAVLFVCAFALSAQADSGLAGLEGKLSAFLASAGAAPSLAAPAESATVIRNNGVIVGYFTVVSGQWWTGLTITNNSSDKNDMTIGCFDASGNAVAGGTLTLGANALKADLIAAFVPTGTVPQRGSIGVFGSAPFIVDRYLGNQQGGFGEVQLESKVF